MSALGQKQTCAPQQGMSALPSTATSIAFFGMSAIGQKRTCVAITQGVAEHALCNQIFEGPDQGSPLLGTPPLSRAGLMRVKSEALSTFSRSSQSASSFLC